MDARVGEALLEVRGVAHAYGRMEVLAGLDLEVRRGALVGVVGENGAGKSTLLKILAGRLAPRTGCVVLRGRVGYCPQEPLVFDSLTVGENLAWFAAAYGLREWRAAASALLERYRLAAYLRAMVGEVSGGTRQKLNLCLALLHDPDLLLLDEPYAGFDWETYLCFWAHAEALRDAGCGVVVVSHLLHDRDRFDAIHTLSKGRLS